MPPLVLVSTPLKFYTETSLINSCLLMGWDLWPIYFKQRDHLNSQSLASWKWTSQRRITRVSFTKKLFRNLFFTYWYFWTHHPSFEYNFFGTHAIHPSNMCSLSLEATSFEHTTGRLFLIFLFILLTVGFSPDTTHFTDF